MEEETCTWARWAKCVVLLMLILTPVSALAASDKGSLLVTARQAGHFETFLEALEATGMTRILEEAGPYTVFAPTDEAFTSMPPQKREVLFSAAHRTELKKLLRYHIVPGRIPSREMDAVGAVPALTQQLHINKQGDMLTVDSAKVIVAGANVENGVFYGIDEVLIPHFHALFLPGS